MVQVKSVQISSDKHEKNRATIFTSDNSFFLWTYNVKKYYHYINSVWVGDNL